MKTMLLTVLATLASALQPPAPTEIEIVTVEDIAQVVIVDNTILPIATPVVGMFAYTDLVAVGILHTDGKVSVYDLNGLMGVDPGDAPLAYDLHYAKATVYERCYLNRASTQVWTKTNCAGMTLADCAKKNLDAENAMKKIDPPHATNPTCP